jgi:hypothetical protein
MTTATTHFAIVLADKFADAMKEKIENGDDEDFTITALTAQFKLLYRAAQATNGIKNKRTKKATAAEGGEKRAPSAYNMFIKENMQRAIDENPGLPPKDRMKVLAAMWKEKKANDSGEDNTTTKSGSDVDDVPVVKKTEETKKPATDDEDFEIEVIDDVAETKKNKKEKKKAKKAKKAAASSDDE